MANTFNPFDPFNPAGGSKTSNNCESQRDKCLEKCEQNRLQDESLGKGGMLAERRYQACVQNCNQAYSNCKSAEQAGGGGGTLACVGGKCKRVEVATPEAIAACRGKAEGDSCSTEPFEEVKPGGCPPESQGAPAWEGCNCGKKFKASGPEKCPPGYVWVAHKQQCECQKWCRDIGYADDCVTYVGTQGGNKLGEFNWPPEIVALYNRLMGRASELLSRKPGFSAAEMEAMFGKGYENIRNLENLTRQRALYDLASQGMLGTGAGQKALRQIPWQSEQNIANLMRDLFLAQQEQKRRDLEAWTGLANELFGRGLNYNQILEAINAARRAEAQNALALWMTFLTQLMANWGRG